MRKKLALATLPLLWTAAAIPASGSLPARSHPEPTYSYHLVGSRRSPAPARTESALLLSGGGEWNLEAFRWFAAKAGHGHIVMLGAYGDGEDGDEFFHRVGRVASVETLVFNSRRASFDPKVLAIIAHADGIFIEGGDQSKYVRFWKNTPVARLINLEIRTGKPVGGTSAGLAVLGRAAYGAMDGGSIDSASALRDPEGPAVTIVRDFLRMPFLDHVVTDTHFTARNRLGRLIAFVARVRLADPRAVGLGIDEQSALRVDARGIGHLSSNNGGLAWLVEPVSRPQMRIGAPLEQSLVRIVGVGAGSTIDLKTLRITHPAFREDLSVRNGVVVNAPAGH